MRRSGTWRCHPHTGLGRRCRRRLCSCLDWHGGSRRWLLDRRRARRWALHNSRTQARAGRHTVQLRRYLWLGTSVGQLLLLLLYRHYFLDCDVVPTKVQLDGRTLSALIILGLFLQVRQKRFDALVAGAAHDGWERHAGVLHGLQVRPAEAVRAALLDSRQLAQCLEQLRQVVGPHWGVLEPAWAVIGTYFLVCKRLQYAPTFMLAPPPATQQPGLPQALRCVLQATPYSPTVSCSHHHLPRSNPGSRRPFDACYRPRPTRLFGTMRTCLCMRCPACPSCSPSPPSCSRG